MVQGFLFDIADFPDFTGTLLLYGLGAIVLIALLVSVVYLLWRLSAIFGSGLEGEESSDDGEFEKDGEEEKLD